MQKSKRIRTVLYGDQRLSSAELEVLHTPAMQRLYGLKQLGLTDRIFIDASHTRIHHVVGVLHQVDKLVDAIVSNLEQSDRRLRIGASESTGQDFSAAELATFVDGRRPVIRFIGLLHDLTHAPFGHTVEDEIRLVEIKHDEPDRQADAFYRLLCQLVAWFSVELNGPDSDSFPQSLRPFLSQGGNAKLPDPSDVGHLAHQLISQTNESKAKLCWRLSCREMAAMFAQLGCAMTALLHLQALHEARPRKSDFPRPEEYKFQAVVRTALRGTSFESLLLEYEFQPNREAFMLDIVGNTVCADLLDYAKRDSHYAGLRLDYDTDRITENFTLAAVDASAYELSHPHMDGGSEHRGERVPVDVIDPFDGWCLRTAISLFSHKYRTDIPSELMNLLNVRFYLYERVIFHPTKCAAGSMLGTALQLLGWRESDGSTRPTLPAHLRFVGDDVFLHDISTTLDFILQWIARIPDEGRIEPSLIEEAKAIDLIHSGLVRTLLELRVGQIAAEVRRELEGARLILNRLAARRYFRPVFRALPSSTDTRLQAGPEALAQVFREPDVRYKAERAIEAQARLPLGTVTIHCPTRTTARKIANVFLTKQADGVDQICKLKDIGSLDGPIFEQHQTAIKAVEQMYRSMWRLTVYVAPEHLGSYEQIIQATGQVIFKTIDAHGQFTGQDLKWENDLNLKNELMARLTTVRGEHPVRGAGPASLGEVVGRISDQLLESGRLKDFPAELIKSPDQIPAGLRARVEEALLAALIAPSTESSVTPPELVSREGEMIKILRTYMQRVSPKDIAKFKGGYSAILNRISQGEFNGVVSDLEGAIQVTKGFDAKQAVHKGYKFNTLLEVLDEILKKRGIFVPRSTKSDLFGDEN